MPCSCWHWTQNTEQPADDIYNLTGFGVWNELLQQLNVILELLLLLLLVTSKSALQSIHPWIHSANWSGRRKVVQKPHPPSPCWWSWSQMGSIIPPVRSGSTMRSFPSWMCLEHFHKARMGRFSICLSCWHCWAEDTLLYLFYIYLYFDKNCVIQFKSHSL